MILLVIVTGLSGCNPSFTSSRVPTLVPPTMVSLTPIARTSLATDSVTPLASLTSVPTAKPAAVATVVFVDESGFYLLPGVVKTYGPRGRTPILHPFDTRDHLSAMSGITMDGNLFTMARDDSLTGPQSVTFLKHLLRYAGERLLVIWEGSPIHRNG